MGGGVATAISGHRNRFPAPIFWWRRSFFISILRWREPQIEMVTSQDSDIRHSNDDVIAKRYAAHRDERLVSERADK